MKSLTILKILLKRAKLFLYNLYINVQAIRMSGILKSKKTYQDLFMPKFNKRANHHSFTINEKVAKSNLTFIHDVILSAVAANMTIKLVLGGNIINYHDWDIYKYSLVYAMVSAAVFLWTDMHKGSWKAINKKELINIAITYAFANLLFFPLFTIMSVGNDISVFYLLLNIFVSSIVVSIPRLVYRLLWDKSHKIANDKFGLVSNRKNIILLGADDDIESFLRANKNKDGDAYNIIGVLDSFSYRVGKQIHGYEIIGTIDDLAELINSNKKSAHNIDHVIVGEGSIKSGFIRDFVIANRNINVDIKYYNRHSGALKNITVDELLTTPEKIEIDFDKSYRDIHNKNILIVNGNAELVVSISRLLGRFNPKKITIMNNNVNDLARAKACLEAEGSLSNYNHGHDGARARNIDDDLSKKVSLEFFNTGVDGINRDLLGLINPSKVIFINDINSTSINLGAIIINNLYEPTMLAEIIREQKIESMLMLSSNRVNEPANASAASIKFTENYLLSMNKATNNKFSVFSVLRFDDFVNSPESVSLYYKEQIKDKESNKLIVNNAVNEEILINNHDASLYTLKTLCEDNDRLKRKGAKFMVRGIGPFNYKELALISIAGNRDLTASNKLKIIENKDKDSIDRRYFSMEEKITNSDKVGYHEVDYQMPAKKYHEFKNKFQDIKILINSKSYEKIIKLINSDEDYYKTKSTSKSIHTTGAVNSNYKREGADVDVAISIGDDKTEIKQEIINKN